MFSKPVADTTADAATSIGKSLGAFNPGRGGLDELHRRVQIDETVNAEPGPSHQFVILPGGSLAPLPQD